MNPGADIIYIKQKKVRHWAALLIVLLIVAGCMQLRIKNVEVQGNETYTAEEAENMIFSGYWDRNTIVCLYNSIRGKKKEIPFVDDYKIVLKSPFDCELRFYEKKPVGCIKYMSNYMYFDKDGMMIESSDRRLDGIPVVEGLNFGYIVLGKKLPVDSSMLLNSIMNITQQLSLYDIDCDAVRYNETGNTMTAVLNGGDISVYFGTDDGLAAKVSALNDMLPEITKRGLKGTLDLSTYDDKQKGNTSSFKLSDTANSMSDMSGVGSEMGQGNTGSEGGQSKTADAHNSGKTDNTGSASNTNKAGNSENAENSDNMGNVR